MNRYYMYWQGKSKRVKAAVEDYLTSGKPVKEIAQKHGVSIVALTNNARCVMRLYHEGIFTTNDIIANDIHTVNKE